MQIEFMPWTTILKKCCQIRSFENIIQELYHTDIIQSPVHLSVGQELSSVLASYFSNEDDHFIGNYRSHALAISVADDIDALILELLGKQKGVFGGRSGSMHLGDPDHNLPWTSAIVASGIPMSTGIAASIKFNNHSQLVTVMFGDGAFEEGCTSESLNFAQLAELPIVFILEDNGLAIHSLKKDRTSVIDYTKKASSFNIKTFKSSYLDPQDMFSKFESAYSYCRSNIKPVFVVAESGRWLEHVGVGTDWDLGYRQQTSNEVWENCDIINNPEIVGLTSQQSNILMNQYTSLYRDKFLRLKFFQDADPSTISNYV